MKKKDFGDQLIADEKRVLIPEGKYTAQCIETKNGLVGQMTAKETYTTTPKVILKFKIIDGQHHGQEIPCF